MPPNKYDEINKTIGNINKATSPLGLTQLPTITSESLTQGTPFNIKPTAPGVEAVGLEGSIEEMTKAFNTDLATKTAKAETLKNDTQKSYLDRILGTKGEATLTSEAYKSGVDPAEAELKDINQQIFEEQVSNRKKIEALRKNTRGMFGGALEQEVDRVNRESVAKQADLAVIQLSKQGKYDSAKTIADRAVAAQLETQKNKNEALKVLYEDNKDNFTKAEQRQFESAQADRNRTLDANEKFLTYRANLIVEASKNQAIPTSVLRQAQLAKSQDEVAQILSPYMQDPLERQLKLAQIASANRANKGGGVSGSGGTLEEQIADLKLSTGQKSDLVDIDTLQEQIASLQSLADSGLEGIGGFGLGTGKQLLFSQLGIGSEGGAKARTTIGNIKGQIAKLRGGTSFTANEEKLLNSYVPGINETQASIVAKLSGLNSFLDSKKNAIIRVGGGIVNEQITRPEDLRTKYNY